MAFGQEEVVVKQEETPKEVDNSTRVKTEFEGVFADDKMRVGSNDHYVFDVSKEEFDQNSTWGRQRMRFKSKDVAGFMRNGKYNLPFVIRYEAENGKKYTKRIK